MTDSKQLLAEALHDVRVSCNADIDGRRRCRPTAAVHLSDAAALLLQSPRLAAVMEKGLRVRDFVDRIEMHLSHLPAIEADDHYNAGLEDGLGVLRAWLKDPAAVEVEMVPRITSNTMRRLTMRRHEHDDCLHCAFEDAEAALPDGLQLHVVRNISGTYLARAWAPTAASTATYKRNKAREAKAGGPNPTAALHALTAALKELKSAEKGASDV